MPASAEADNVAETLWEVSEAARIAAAGEGISLGVAGARCA